MQHVGEVYEHLHLARLAYYDDVARSLYLWKGKWTVYVFDEWGRTAAVHVLPMNETWDWESVLAYVVRLINDKRRQAQGIAQGYDPDDPSRVWPCGE